MLLRGPVLGALCSLGSATTAKNARAFLMAGKPSMIEQEGFVDYNISESGRFPGEEAALKALATPRLAIGAVVVGIFAGFAGNLLSL